MADPCVIKNYAGKSGGFAPAAFTPKSLGDMRLWLDFDDESTLFQDTALTNPVTTPGQIIRRTLDKSGQGNTFGGPSDAQSPIYGEFTNGRKCAILNGTNQYTQALGTSPIATFNFMRSDSGYTALMYTKLDTIGPDTVAALWSTAEPGNGFPSGDVMLLTNGAGLGVLSLSYAQYIGPKSPNLLASSADDTIDYNPRVIGSTFKWGQTGDDYNGYIDGTNAMSGEPTSQPSTSTIQTINGRLRVGNLIGSTPALYGGRIQRFWVWAGLLSPDALEKARQKIMLPRDMWNT